MIKEGMNDKKNILNRIINSSALQLLDFCYHLDDDLTQHLLTASLDNWSRKTCLSLAVIAQNLK